MKRGLVRDLGCIRYLLERCVDRAFWFRSWTCSVDLNCERRLNVCPIFYFLLYFLLFLFPLLTFFLCCHPLMSISRRVAWNRVNKYNGKDPVYSISFL